jgi:hypothetical protein
MNSKKEKLGYKTMLFCGRILPEKVQTGGASACKPCILITFPRLGQ